MIRLKSEIWVQAYLRSWFAAGGYGAVLRRGAPEAGAVYVAINRLDDRIITQRHSCRTLLIEIDDHAGQALSGRFARRKAGDES